MMTGDLVTFAAVMALGQFSPGPDMLLLTRTALSDGRRAGWWMTAGITSGLCVHAAIAIGWMAWLTARGGWIAVGLRWAACAYLAWLGARLILKACTSRGAQRPASASPAGRTGSAYVRGLLCNLLNPKAALFFAGVVAPFLAGERPLWWPAALWGIIVFQGMVLWGLWVAVLQSPPIRNGYGRAARWIDAAFGAGLLALAVTVALR